MASSVPADGSIISSADSIIVTATESIASVTGVALDGSGTVAPTISGTTITFPTGSLASGAHALVGTLVDEAGLRGRFRIAFTLPDPSAKDGPPVEKNTSPTAETTLSSVDGSVKMTFSGTRITNSADGQAISLSLPDQIFTWQPGGTCP